MDLGTHSSTPATSPLDDSASQIDQSTDIRPGAFRVIKRNGVVVPFDRSKVTVAITKAFLAVEGGQASGSARVREMCERFTDMVEATYLRRMPSGGTLHIEDIQDQVELVLMRAGEHKTAKAFVLYRAAQAEKRAAQAPQHEEELHPTINVKLDDGSNTALDVGRLRFIVDEATADLENVDGERILEDTLRNLYDGIPSKEVSTALVMTARVLVEEEPNYSQVTARLLMDIIRAEGLSFMGLAENATHADMHALYPEALKAYIKKAAELELVSDELNNYDLDKLGAALEVDRDLQFGYLGLQTLYDRYFIHSNEVRFELPQVFFMRVAMGLALEEENREERAIEFYRLLSSFDYMSSTPTLFNAGTLRSQLSSCYLTTVPDDLSEIYGAIRDNALLSKFAGGLGNDWTPVRSLGSRIKGTNGKSQGVVPFLKVANDTAVAVNQGGKRKGAVCAYLETWHLDIEEFLELRKNTGDERRRTHDMNTANWVPDLFMKRVFNDEEWTLFSPSDCPDLHDLYGSAFEKRYNEYEEMTRNGQLTLFRRVKAADIWRKMLSMLFETGHPWVTFKDSCNLRSPQQHVGVIHSSNLCTEITLNTSIDEIAVCNLGSVNLKAHVSRDGGLDHAKLKETITTAIRMLDNVIDINYYSVPQAKNSNLKHRPIGLGLMGFQDALYEMGYAYGSPEAVQFADESMEAISYYAIEASSDLAAERGQYQTYSGSLWDQGIFPVDSLDILERERGSDYIKVDRSAAMDWTPIREKVKRQGMRNSNVMAIAPTATIANITGVSQSIEPTYQNLYVKSNLSGEFTVVNPYLVKELKERGLWDSVMVNDLKYFDGSVQQIDRIPADLKALFATAFEVEPRWIVDAASRRQKWLDQAQSLNLYISGVSGKKLDVTYRMAWFSGLKTTYYLRAMGASSTEKSTVASRPAADKAPAPAPAVAAPAAAPAPAAPKAAATDFELGEGQAVPKACSLDDPDCEACQ